MLFSPSLIFFIFIISTRHAAPSRSPLPVNFSQQYSAKYSVFIVSKCPSPAHSTSRHENSEYTPSCSDCRYGSSAPHAPPSLLPSSTIFCA